MNLEFRHFYERITLLANTWLQNMPSLTLVTISYLLI